MMAISAAAMFGLSVRANAAVTVEQIEAGYTTQNGANYNYSLYAPVEFGGSPTFAGTGIFAGITFNAVDTGNDTNTLDSTGHAGVVATDIYANSTVAYPYVTTVYNAQATDFLLNTVDANSPAPGDLYLQGVNPVPAVFPAGVKVVNNSWVSGWGYAGSDLTASQATSINLDMLRRFDFMVNRQDVVSVAGAVSSEEDETNTYFATPLLWDSYNTLAVSGTYFTIGSPALKQHVDLYVAGQPSFGAAAVSSYATALLGIAQTAGQTDAQHSYLIRSLLLSGASKAYYQSPGGGTAGAMNAIYGAGEPDYDTSLAILQAGEKTLSQVSSGSFAATPVTTQDGWTIGNVSGGAQAAVLIQTSYAVTRFTASLNWNVTSQTSGTSPNMAINTANGAVIFPNLEFEIRPVTYNSGTGKYVLGAAETDLNFISNVSGDNTQYIYTDVTVPAGNYALLVTSNASSSLASVGLSYTLGGSFISQWNRSTGGSWGTTFNWIGGVPNGQGAQAILPSLSTPSTITLDGDRTVGQLTFNSSNGYTISPGTIPSGVTDTLTFDDTGDSTGTANQLITVLAGNQTISAPIYLAGYLYANVSSGTSLTLSGPVTTSYAGVVMNGAGTLTLSAPDSYNTYVNAGTLVLGTGATVAAPGIFYVNGGALNLAASTTSGIFQRNLAGPVNLSAGSVVVAAASSSANRQLVIFSGGLSIAGATNNWIGKIDLNNNDVDIPAGGSETIAAVVNQIKEGYNAGHWNGTGGIVSTSAASNSTHLMALGVIQNNQDGAAIYTASNLFDGYSPGASDILVKYTYYGDANLDGKVDGSDYTLIDNGYLNHLTGWYNGDFNYDGVINGSDYALIDNSFNTQGARISAEVSPAAVGSVEIAGSASAVPEPGCALILIPGIALISRRRRRFRG